MRTVLQENLNPLLKVRVLRVVSDSKYCVLGITTWMTRWHANGWQRRSDLTSKASTDKDTSCFTELENRWCGTCVWTWDEKYRLYRTVQESTRICLMKRTSYGQEECEEGKGL